MPRTVEVSRESLLMKPPHGEACNRCGLCCEASVCPLFSQAILKRPGVPIGNAGKRVEALPAGRCPALLGGPGTASCGLVEQPEEWMPVRTHAVGKAAMSAAARTLLNAGDGCDSRINGEPNNDVFDYYLSQLDLARAPEIRRAKRLWEIDR